MVKTIEAMLPTLRPAHRNSRSRSVLRSAFIERTENLVLLGLPNVGKSYLAMVLSYPAVIAGPLSFDLCRRLISRYSEGFSALEGALQNIPHRWSTCRDVRVSVRRMHIALLTRSRRKAAHCRCRRDIQLRGHEGVFTVAESMRRENTLPVTISGPTRGAIK
jgi:hypothetical protein